MKAYYRTASLVVLGAFLGGCQVYDGELVGSKTPASSKVPATQSFSSDAAAVQAAPGQVPVVSRATAADGGSETVRQARNPERGAQPSDDGDDSGVISADSGLGSMSPDEPVNEPAADGGQMDASASDAGCEPTLDGGCSSGWLRRITLDGSQVSAELSDFPVLVRISDDHLREHAASGGDDLYFVADDGLTALDFEVESFSAAGDLVAWVRVPSLAAGQDTTLFLGYGDGKTGRAKPTSVWSDFHDVWHLAEDPTAADPAIHDSTERAHGSVAGGMSADALISGVAGAGLRFDGVDDEISFFNDIFGSGPSTFSGWVKQEGSLGQYGTSMISLGGDDDGAARFMLSRADDQKLKCGFLGDDDITTAILPLDEWKYVSWTWDGFVSSVFVDAVRVLGPVSHTRVNTAGLIGKLGNTSFRFEYFMYGQMDELRIATTARTGAWISTEYANQRPASTFIKAVGEPELAIQH